MKVVNYQISREIINTAKTKTKNVFQKIIRKKIGKKFFQLYCIYGKVVVIKIHKKIFRNLRFRDQNCQMFHKFHKKLKSAPQVTLFAFFMEKS